MLTYPRAMATNQGNWSSPAQAFRGGIRRGLIVSSYPEAGRLRIQNVTSRPTSFGVAMARTGAHFSRMIPNAPSQGSTRS